MKTSKPKKLRSSNSWWCDTCQTKEMSHKQIMEHLKKSHGIKSSKIKATRKMVIHLDGADYFTSQFEVIIKHKGKQIKMTNAVSQERDADDLMRLA